MNSVKTFFIILMLSIFLLSDNCAYALSFLDRGYGAQKAAIKNGFVREYVRAGNFTLTTYERLNWGNKGDSPRLYKNIVRGQSPLLQGQLLLSGAAPSGSIRIYIEGDGRAWETRTRLSDDPTPSDPVALMLATCDSSDSVAYIARPGQFPQDGFPSCDPTYWSARRFSPEVIDDFDEAVELVKAKSGARYVELVGYSGGAAIAVLLAARRSDVSSLRTVAGNLDPKGLCAYHGVSELAGSMDPMDAAGKVSGIPQRHFVGGKDKVVPAIIAESFVTREGDPDLKTITVIECATHKDGWKKNWQRLLAMPLEKIRGAP